MNMQGRKPSWISIAGLAAVGCLLAAPAARASSHQDAPLITLDEAANTTDVYSFVTERNGAKYLTVALAVYPFEEPGIGPNIFRFDDNVRYNLHVATGADVAKGVPTFTYQFQFKTTFKNQNTILQAFTGVVNDVDDANQNLVQTYRVTKIDSRSGKETLLGEGKTPPNNQGNATPLYNQGNNGENLAKPGVANQDALDPLTAKSVFDLNRGYRVFAGQRDDGFYADVQAIFDLAKIRPPGKAQDSQGGFNVHTIVLQIPVSELGGDQQVAGVYATTHRRSVIILPKTNSTARLAPGTLPENSAPFVQVGRQGNPLFNEVLVALVDKDLYSRTTPNQDAKLFRKYAETPEVAKLLNKLVLPKPIPGIETNRTDLVGIFIPDLIKTDLSTGPVRLAGGGAKDTDNPDDPGFSNLGVFGGDVLTSKVQKGVDGKGTVPGGWPNGRRFGDDVATIALTAVASDLTTVPPTVRGPISDNVTSNDIPYNKVMPYAATPHNGRIHIHHDGLPPTTGPTTIK
jgi:hypothetical protein